MSHEYVVDELSHFHVLACGTMSSLVSMSFDHIERVISTHEWLTLVVELNFGAEPTTAAEPCSRLGNLAIGHVDIASGGVRSLSSPAR